MIEHKQMPLTAAGNRRLFPILALALIAIDLILICFYLGQRVYLRNPVWIYLAVYTVLFLLYSYSGSRIVPYIPPNSQRTALAIILLAAVLMRVCVLPAPPSLSTDMYRYVWDGRLSANGINPYHYAPNAQPLRHFRDELWDKMDYKAYQTIYMPISQLFFAVGYGISGSNLTGLKSLFTLFDLGVIGLLMVLLRHLQRPLNNIIWYAWCPLPITEISLAGHQDVVGVFFLMAAIVLAIRRRPSLLSAVALVAAALTKGFALLLLPLFSRAYGKRYAVITVVSLIYMGMPLWVYFPNFLHGMRQYLEMVHVNAGLFYGVDQVLLPISRYHYTVTNDLSNCVILGTTLWAASKPVTDTVDLLRRAFLVVTITLLVVPTLFPWYLLWILPFLPLLRQRPSWAFILLCWLVTFVYTYYISMRPYPWVALVEYVPFYLLLLTEFLQWRNRSKGIIPQSIENLSQ